MSAETNAAGFPSALFDLSGRVALVTGAGQNVGAGIAVRLAQRGAAVAVNDYFPERAESTVRSITAAGGRAIAVPADVTDQDAVRGAVQRSVDELGSVDILVNNVGVPPNGIALGTFLDTTPADWDRYFQINLYGVMYGVHAVLPAMIERRWGRIVTIVSDAGRFGEPSMAAYGASKAGAAGFVRGISKEVGRHGVTSNAISLGGMSNPEYAEGAEARARRYPMKRLGTPDDVAAAVVWLASDDAGWITGQTISLNGGYISGP